MFEDKPRNTKHLRNLYKICLNDRRAGTPSYTKAALINGHKKAYNRNNGAFLSGSLTPKELYLDDELLKRYGFETGEWPELM